jgi:endonuclease-8
MPEGDTVYRQCQVLDEALAGCVLTRAELRVPQIANADLLRRRVTEVRPRGKHLLIRLDPSAEGAPALTLHSHLRMDGIWRTDGAFFRSGDVGRGPRPEHTVRIVLEGEHEDGRIARAVAYDVKDVRLVRTAEEHELVGHLGPDLLDPHWGPAHEQRAVSNLLADPERPIGLVLLDQRVMAGPGNIYRSELSFLARLHPTSPIGRLEDPTDLIRRAHRLLDVNKDRVVRVTTGGLMGRGGDLWVYGRAGQPCRRCGTRIETGGMRDPRQPGTTDRTFSYCPRCQN